MDAVGQLLYLQGVAAEYYGYDGSHHQLTHDQRCAVLRWLGYDLDDLQAIEEANFALDARPWQSPLLAWQWTSQQAPNFVVQLSSAQLHQPLLWTIHLEQGGSLKCEHAVTGHHLTETGHYRIDGTDYSRRKVSLNVLPTGYHKLTIQVGDERCHGELLVSPNQCYQPTKALNGRRGWGLTVQLYSLRSEQNWGIGDFADLQQLIREVAKHGGDFIQLNPLHALFINEPLRCSPYSPSDRCWLNPLYIHVEHCPDFNCDTLQTLVRSPQWQQQLQVLRAADWLDYAAIAELKSRALLAMYQRFVLHEIEQDTPRSQVFLQYCQHKPALDQFVQHQLLLCKAHSYLPQDGNFYRYLQWLAETQLAQCQLLCDELGMVIGLVRDLAVGACADGAEVKRNEQLFISQASIGAPPDPLAPQGQNWGLPPMDPVRLKQQQFKHFRQLLQANLSHAGALRIDHVMALLRLWWCAANGSVGGAYVYYPMAELLAILRMESHAAKTLIVGEDLGVVPEQIKTAMLENRLVGNELLYFAQHHDGRYKLPSEFREPCMLMLANHDVPPVAAWWQGLDLSVRVQLGLVDETELTALQKQRQTQLDALMACLQRQDLLTTANPDYSQFFTALVKYGARSNAQWFALQLDDIEGQVAAVNIPGTSQEYRNWQRRLRWSIADYFNDPSWFDDLTQIRRQKESSL